MFWYYTKNYEILIYKRKNYGTIPKTMKLKLFMEKLWYYLGKKLWYYGEKSFGTIIILYYYNTENY